MFYTKVKAPLTLLVILFIFSVLNSHAQTIEIKPHNLTLNAQLELAEGKQLSDGVILLTHGTLAHNGMEIIAGMQSLLAESGFSTLAINLSLGINNRIGFYDCQVPHTHHHEDAVNEINSWVKWLRNQGVSSIVLAGHSRGGNQTAWYASEAKLDSIDKVVLIAPMVWNFDASNKEYKDKYKTELKSVFAQAKTMEKNNKAYLENTDFIYCEDTKVLPGSFISYYKNEPRLDTPSLLKKISKPVLIIAGSEDNIVKGLIEQTQPLLDKNNIQMTVIDGAGHMFLDLYLEELVESMVDFIDS